MKSRPIVQLAMLFFSLGKFSDLSENFLEFNIRQFFLEFLRFSISRIIFYIALATICTAIEIIAVIESFLDNIPTVPLKMIK